MTKILDKLSYQQILLFCLTLGLSPFAPPHLYEKLNMIFLGQLSKPIDLFDLLFHASPWIILILKIYSDWRSKKI